MKTTLPEIGEMITTDRALELCLHFGFNHIVERIRADPDDYKRWKFDGCSGIPDELMGLFTGCDWEDITFKCCLPHDLEYAYGLPGDVFERERVDTEFQHNLIVKAHMKRWLSKAFFTAVRAGGNEKLGLSFSWGFAAK